MIVHFFWQNSLGLYPFMEPNTAKAFDADLLGFLSDLYLIFLFVLLFRFYCTQSKRASFQVAKYHSKASKNYKWNLP